MCVYIYIILELYMEISTHPYYQNIFEHLILYLLKDDDIFFKGQFFFEQTWGTFLP